MNQNKLSGYLHREVTKPIYRGLLSVPDFAFLLANLGRRVADKEPWKYPSQYTDDFVDWSTDGHSKGEPSSIIGKGIEFGVGVGSGGTFANLAKAGARGLKAIAPTSKVASKGAATLEKTAPFLGSTKRSDIIGGAVAGGATQYAEDLGYSSLAAAGIGLGAGIGIGAFSPIKKLDKLDKIKNFDLEAYEAAKRQGLNLPRVSFDKSFLTEMATTGGDKRPFVGAALSRQANKAIQTTQRRVETILDDTGTIRPENIVKEKSNKIPIPRGELLYPYDTQKRLSGIKAYIQANKGFSRPRKESLLEQIEELETILKPNLQYNGKFSSSALYDAIPQINKLQARQTVHTDRDRVWRHVLENMDAGIKNDLNIAPTYKATDTLGSYPGGIGRYEMRVATRRRIKQNEFLGTEDAFNFNPNAFRENYKKAEFNEEFKDLVSKAHRKELNDVATAIRKLPRNIEALSTDNTNIVNISYYNLLYGIIERVRLHRGQSLEKLANYVRTKTPEDAKKFNNTFTKELKKIGIKAAAPQIRIITQDHLKKRID